MKLKSILTMSLFVIPPIILIIMMTTLIPANTLWAAEIILETNTKQALQNEINKAGTTPTTILISADFPLKSSIVQIPANAKITIKSDPNAEGAPFTLTQTSVRHFSVNGTLILEDIILDGSSTSNSSSSSGGIITSSSANLIMNQGTIIRNCYYSASGGGILMDGGVFTMNSGTLTGNTAASAGGAVLISANSTFVMNGGVISGNTAKGSKNAGSGVFVKGTFHMNNGEISHNIATASLAGGAGVAVYDNGTFIMGTGSDAENPVISHNHSPLNGGGVYVIHGRFTMNSGEIRNNTATHGGGIYSGTANPIIIAGGAVRNNKATKNGGGLYGENITITGKDTIISGNAAENGNGGGVYELASLTIDASLISDNQATNISGTTGLGGGVFMAANGAALNMKNGAGIVGNKTMGNSGGGVYMGGNGTVSMDSNSHISKNETAELGAGNCNGGGIFAAGDMTVTGGMVSRNKARHLGGGVYGTGNITMTHTVIGGNTADTHGGGVYALKNITLDNAKISKDENGKPNTSDSGGGLYMHHTDYTLDMKNGSEISGNLAAGGGGVETGSVKGPNSLITTIKLDDTSKISDNTANNGGGINAVGPIALSGGTISGNKANLNGGGIFVGGNLNVSGNTLITGNNAYCGGGVFVFDTGSTIIDYCSLTSNTAIIGGGIFTTDTTYVNLTTGSNTNFSNNNAASAHMLSGDLDSLHPNLQYASVTVPFTHPLNNFDINTVPIPTQCRIIFNTGSDTIIPDQEKNFGETIDIPANPSKTGYAFLGWWIKDGNGDLDYKWDFHTVLAPEKHGTELVLHAVWDILNMTVTGKISGLPNNSIPINYSTDGGATTDITTSDIQGNYSISLLYDSALLIIPPAQTGYDLDPESRSISVTTENLIDNDFLYTLAEFAVTFDSNDGSAIETQTVSYGERAIQPTAPEKPGYAFAQWYTDDGTFADAWDFDNDTVTTDITLYANWLAVSPLQASPSTSERPSFPLERPDLEQISEPLDLTEISDPLIPLAAKEPSENGTQVYPALWILLLILLLLAGIWFLFWLKHRRKREENDQ